MRSRSQLRKDSEAGVWKLGYGSWGTEAGVQKLKLEYGSWSTEAGGKTALIYNDIVKTMKEKNKKEMVSKN